MTKKVLKPKNPRFTNERIIKDCLKIINEKKCFFFDDIFPYTSFDRSTFYKRNLHEFDAIKEALENNRIMGKSGLRNKWYNGNNSTAQIALYKLIGTDSERDILNGNNDINVNADLDFNVKFDD